MVYLYLLSTSQRHPHGLARYEMHDLYRIKHVSNLYIYRKKIFAENIYNKGLLSKIYKKHLKLKINKMN